MAFPLKIRGRSFGPHKYLSDSDSDVVSRILLAGCSVFLVVDVWAFVVFCVIRRAGLWQVSIPQCLQIVVLSSTGSEFLVVVLSVPVRVWWQRMRKVMWQLVLARRTPILCFLRVSQNVLCLWSRVMYSLSVMLPCVTYTMLVIDLELHGSWQNFICKVLIILWLSSSGNWENGTHISYLYYTVSNN